jgi:hypothetical protein
MFDGTGQDKKSIPQFIGIDFFRDLLGLDLAIAFPTVELDGFLLHVHLRRGRY